jgi:hypothetical protein
MLDLFIMLVYEQTRDNARRLTSQFRRRGIMSLRTNTTSLVASVGAFYLKAPHHPGTGYCQRNHPVDCSQGYQLFALRVECLRHESTWSD